MDTPINASNIAHQDFGHLHTREELSKKVREVFAVPGKGTYCLFLVESTCQHFHN